MTFRWSLILFGNSVVCVCFCVYIHDLVLSRRCQRVVSFLTILSGLDDVKF